MKIQLTRPQQRFLFLLAITVIYLFVIFYLDFLRGPYWWDEEYFWRTSLRFSDSIIPSLEDIKGYEELNTPLPFIIFGILENLFGQGIMAGRLFNLILSLVIVFIIGWPTKEKGARRLVCLIGLLLCPYYLWLSGRLYTEMIACFWLMMGLMAYVRNLPWWSCLAFVLAISSRQYLVAFPAAIAAYELIYAIPKARQMEDIDWAAHQSWIAPGLAAASLLGWFALFDGLAPQAAYDFREEWVPEVQRTLWGIRPDGLTHFLSFVGIYIVIPEFLLFAPRQRLRNLKQHWRQHRLKVGLIALGLLVFVVVFPPQPDASGNVAKIATSLPYELLQNGFYYVFSLITCLRFSAFSLVMLMVLFNGLIMMKAHPWDRYVLPMVVAFWYLKSVHWVGKQPPIVTPAQPSQVPPTTTLQSE